MKRTIIYILTIMLASLAENELIAQHWNGQAASGTYKLTGNVTMNARVIVTSDLTIDLDGFNIYGPSATQTFSVDEGATLTISDSKNSGKIIGHANGGGDRGGFAYISGTLNLEGGAIYGYSTQFERNDNADEVNFPTQGCGGAVYINDGGIFNMSGGTIEACKTELNSSGELVLAGGAVFIDSDHDSGVSTIFNFSGGTIKDCEAGIGGGVYVHSPIAYPQSKAIFNMSGTARIENCKAHYNGFTTMGGGGVMVNSSIVNNAIDCAGEFYMSGGIITDCKSNGGGCGVLVLGKMKMTGGSITNCQPINWVSPSYPNTYTYGLNGVHGGGVLVNTRRGVFTMEAGEITNNKASSGAGVMVWGDDEKLGGRSTFNMGIENSSSTAKISGNESLGADGLGNGGAVYVQTSTFNFYSGTLSDNKAVRYGGAININMSASLNLLGDCIIQNNIASHGGGISQEAGKCIMNLDHSGISITGNTANGMIVSTTNGQIQNEGNGGGLFIEKGELTINSGTISDNIATGCGGGMAIHLERIAGDASVIINGGTIQNNEATKGNGGAISMRAQIETTANDDANNKNDIVFKLESGTVSNNKAVNGGGIFIDINDKATAHMTIGTLNDIPIISGNKAKNNGGALGLNHGTIDIIKGRLSDNHASWENTIGDGGAVYLAAGSFNVTGEATIFGNSAVDGGAIYVENGNVVIEKGDIFNNTASKYGGGLYVYNSDNASDRTISFSGGTFTGNRARNGGGICANGKMHVYISATIENNRATNGGGIYLTNQANMTFSDGLIKGNKAESDGISLSGTAYRKDGTTLVGVGGGVFLAGNTTLDFNLATELGLYNNRADNAADDIFANGNSTSVSLPNVALMKLKDMNVPTDRLFWMEDYMNSDEQYAMGSKCNPNPEEPNYRYQQALREIRGVFHLGDASDSPDLTPYSEKYLCLALGYELVYLTLTKEGLDKGDDATFMISYEKDGAATLYQKVFIIGTGETVKKTIVLPEGSWKFEESTWSWRYDTPVYSPALDANGYIMLTRGSTNGGTNAITVTNRKKKNIDNADIRDYDFHKVNRIKP